MKKKLIILTTLLISLSSCAQTIKPLASATRNDYANGNYIKDTSGLYNPFVGTWQWTNGTNTLIFKFEKKANYNPLNDADFSDDVLLGGYKYIENGVTITDCLTFTTNNIYSSTHAKILGSLQCAQNIFDELTINMQDVAKHKSIFGVFKLLYNPTVMQDFEFVPTAQLSLQPRENSFPSVTNPPLPGESFPYNVILTKIE